MRVVINQALLDRYRRISHILFFVSLAGMGIGFFYTWTSNPNGQTSQLSCLILPILLLMTLTSVRMANMWIREPRPVNVLSDALKGMGRKYSIFHHVLPAPHVLIGPEGVFTIKPVWQDRPFRVQGKKWHGDEGLLRKLNGYLRQDLLGNPFNDALFEAQQVQKLVDKIAPDSGVEVQPLVVFIHPHAEFEADEPAIPVLYADSKKKPSLRNYLRDVKYENRATLSEEHLDRIDQMFQLVTRQDIGEMFGQIPDEEEEGEEPVRGTRAARRQQDRDHRRGAVGQLFYIGRPPGPSKRNWNITCHSPDIELCTLFRPRTRPALRLLRRKFTPKRQKDNWFGLSRKDVAWLKSRRDQLN
jgi:hypothetical protein